MASSIDTPDELLARLEQAAAKEKVSPEELVVEAVEEHLRRKRLQDLYARGERRARELGIPENKVDAIVREERDQVKLDRYYTASRLIQTSGFPRLLRRSSQADRHGRVRKTRAGDFGRHHRRDQAYSG